MLARNARCEGVVVVVMVIVMVDFNVVVVVVCCCCCVNTCIVEPSFDAVEVGILLSSFFFSLVSQYKKNKQQFSG